ncbi:nuclear transport factor 2 family protein [Oxalobacteraceae bacterium OTU3CINTB1]|nr:nuclear transport factor 2 family protein [Oxalobacteraceae bacterium OTU3CINTB1]
MMGLRLILLAVMFFVVQGQVVAAEPKPADLEAAVRQADNAYWAAYNRADPVAMNAFLADDVEFYHDRGGTLIGKKALAAVNSEMGTGDHTLRRDAIPGTVKFFPMRKDDVIYGYLSTGEHQFTVLPKDKPEFLAGRALFTQLWVLQGKEWKVSRIFSYEHADAK